MSLVPQSPSRRAVLRTAAWTLPVVTVAAAAPAFAVSDPPQVDLWATISMPVEPPTGMTFDGEPIYGGSPLVGPTYTHTAVFGNRGPEALPAGAHFTIGLGLGAFWDSFAVTVIGVSHTTPVTDFQPQPLTPPVTADRELHVFTLTQQLGAGDSFAITFTADLLATPQVGETWTGGPDDHPSFRHLAQFAVGTSGAIDIDPMNNTGESPESFVINQAS